MSPIGTRRHFVASQHSVASGGKTVTSSVYVSVGAASAPRMAAPVR